jgi:putative ABC transport system permease protein
LDLLAAGALPAVVLPSTNLSPYVTIVGIIGNTRNDDLQRDPQPAALIPYTILAPPTRTLALRGQGEPAALMNALRAQVREMDKEQPMNGPVTFEEILSAQRAQPRFITALFSLFAGLGLALAMAGIYSVLSYLVSRRTREIGVRMALGAQRSDVLRLFFQSGGKLVGLGILIGILASAAVARILLSQLDLVQVQSTDPISFLGVVALMSAAAAAACFIPAYRAANVDAMVALRTE